MLERQPNRGFALRGFTLIELLIVMAIIGILVGLLLPAAQSMRRTARKTECINKVRQLTTATLAYQSQFRHFPSGVVDNDDDHRDGQTSGLIFLLSFLELENLDRQYDRSQAWNSAANINLAQTVVPAFLCPENSSQVEQNGGVMGSASDYAFCKGDLAYLSRNHAPTGIFDINSRTRANEIKDGLSNTFLFGEAASNPNIAAAST